jgi:TRAP-type C4-dicarboxylate transport system substrate-binding protein
MAFSRKNTFGKMIKNLGHFIGILAIIVVISLAGFSQASGKTTLRLSNGLAPGTFQNAKVLPSFAKEVQEGTDGRIIVELYPAGQLYRHIETADALHRGGVEMGFLSVNHWAGYNPVFGWNDYPFLVKDLDHFRQNEDKAFTIVDDLLEKIGAKLLAFVPYSSTCIASKTLIERPEDVKGLRIRGISDPFFDAVKAWGGVPTAMRASEVYDALAKGTLTGAMTGWQSVEKRKFYEAAGYVAGTTSPSIWGIFVNLKTWKGLPNDVRDIIEKAAKNAHEMGFKGQAEIDEGSRKFLKKSGMIVKVFTPEEKVIWRKATKPAYDKYVERCTGKGYGDIANKVLEMFE